MNQRAKMEGLETESVVQMEQNLKIMLQNHGLLVQKLEKDITSLKITNERLVDSSNRLIEDNEKLKDENRRSVEDYEKKIHKLKMDLKQEKTLNQRLSEDLIAHYNIEEQDSGIPNLENPIKKERLIPEVKDIDKVNEDFKKIIENLENIIVEKNRMLEELNKKSEALSYSKKNVVVELRKIHQEKNTAVKKLELEQRKSEEMKGKISHLESENLKLVDKINEFEFKNKNLEIEKMMIKGQLRGSNQKLENCRKRMAELSEQSVSKKIKNDLQAKGKFKDKRYTFEIYKCRDNLIFSKITC